MKQLQWSKTIRKSC